MEANKKLKVVIAGGGTAGWMSACAMARQLSHYLDITLVESEQIGTVGVGEATIPTMQTFHLLLQIEEQEFIRETQATFKLGIQFENWGAKGDSYLHSFGETGKETWAGQFQHFWLRGKKEGVNHGFGEYSLEHQAALAGKFAVTKNPRLNYAYHLDAGLYAKYLRRLSESDGVKRVEGKISRVELSEESGDIRALHLESGQSIEGDLFIDCTGFVGLLIEKALHTGYEDWTNMLLCDRAMAVQTTADPQLLPYTRAIAHDSGWQWRIPLQNRVGNGLVYSSKFLSDQQASDLLSKNIDGDTINEPRIIPFKPGRRLKTWNKNCVAIGLSSGFIEPLESTSIHLIASSIIRLMRFIPLSGVKSVDRDEYNRQAADELQSIRDFIVLHYKATEREDSEFWRYCKNMDIPDSLHTRMAMYQDSGRIFWLQDELFTVNSWNQVMLGQRLSPEGYHPVADAMSAEDLKRYLDGLRSSISAVVDKLPSHAEFVKTSAM